MTYWSCHAFLEQPAGCGNSATGCFVSALTDWPLESHHVNLKKKTLKSLLFSGGIDWSYPAKTFAA